MLCLFQQTGKDQIEVVDFKVIMETEQSCLEEEYQLLSESFALND